MEIKKIFTRRRADSNRRITVLQTVALGLLATPPVLNYLEFTLIYRELQQNFSHNSGVVEIFLAMIRRIQVVDVADC
jgi:hypothetical protein